MMRKMPEWMREQRNNNKKNKNKKSTAVGKLQRIFYLHFSVWIQGFC